MRDPEANRQDAIEFACYRALYRALDVMTNEMPSENGNKLRIDLLPMLIAALKVIESERTKQPQGLSAPWTHQDVINRLQLMNREHIQSKALRRRRTQP